ncbi:MAG: cation:dicarboxylase symporter family transporter, partial [Candidatus Wallbacteria bacterium]|nr:cation:dicarboxylase symporter family transporter [Candidatus Wallbacteria bacterium]
VFGGMILGVAFGVYFPEGLGRFEMLGDIYLTLLQMCALPIMLTAIMTSLGKLFHSSQAGRFLKSIFFLMLMLILASSLSGLLAGILGKVGSGIGSDSRELLGCKLHEAEVSEGAGEQRLENPTDILMRLIPSNIFNALSNGDFLSVLFFSIVMGLSLGLIRNESSAMIISFLDTIFNAFLQIINWSMYLLPIALFCLLAGQVSSTGAQILVAMTRFIVIFHILSLVFIFISVFSLSRSTGCGLGKVFLSLKESLVVAFGTFNSYAAMPLAIEGMHSGLGIDRQTSKLVMPLGVTISRPSTFLNFSLGTVFIAQLYNVSLLDNNVWIFVLMGVIVAGLAGTGAPGAIEISMLSLVLTPLGLPAEVALVFLLAVDPIIEPVGTVLDVLSSCGITGLINKEKAFIKKE